jgi:hypothetical protein
MDFPKLSTPILLLIIAAICLLIAKDAEKLPDWLRFGVGVVGVIFGIAGSLSAVNWLTYATAARAEDIQRARAMTPAVLLADRRLQLVEKVANLPPDRIMALASMIMPIYEFIGGSIGPIPALRVSDDNIPYWFVGKFWELSTDTHLVPVRTWASETRERKWAEELTNYLINFGLARPAVGNQPAAWMNAEAAHVWLFGKGD